MRKAVLCVAVAFAMFVGVAIPRVYAENYSPSDVKVGETVVQEGDVLEFPEGADQGMLIHYLDDNNNFLSIVNIEKGKNYTIPDYNSLGIYSQIEVGMKFDGWKVMKKPAEGAGQPQWELRRCLKSSKDASGNNAENAIYLTGSYTLKKDTVYTLKDGLTHVQGDATTYAKEIQFTVKADEQTQYFFK